MRVKKYYGSFGSDHMNTGCIQPIWAKDSVQAKKLMDMYHGKEWCWIYNESEGLERIDAVGYEVLPEIEIPE